MRAGRIRSRTRFPNRRVPLVGRRPVPPDPRQDSDAFTLFDIGNDPLEQLDLYDPAHPEFAPLRNALVGWLDQTGKRGRLDESTTADRAKEEELRALGYLE